MAVRFEIEDPALGSVPLATGLLDDLRVGALIRPGNVEIHPALRWAECGGMALTGRGDGPPLMCPVPLASCADAALAALGAIHDAPVTAPRPRGQPLPAGGDLLTERAALAGLMRNGRTSAGGACRLLECADGRIAITLARTDDWQSMPALLGDEDGPPRQARADELSPPAHGWPRIEAAVASQPVHAIVERARLLSLAVAADRRDERASDRWLEIDCEDRTATRARQGERPLVVDLSSLWAGPLCTHLLDLCGARVVRVESTTRPDGARSSPAFHDLLNYGKSSMALDLTADRDRDLLRRLLAQADIVVEASRPRALRQLGIDSAEFCGSGRAQTWIRITAHGVAPPQGEWIGFGDDASVAAGLTTLLQQAGAEPVFVGDAIADPLTGMHAALAAWWSYRAGGSRRISLSLRGVTEHCILSGAALDAAALRERQVRWSLLVREAGIQPACEPRRRPNGPARALGADTESIVREFSLAGATA